MSGMLFALALFGCSDDASYCERLSDKAARFDSKVACEMEAVGALESDKAMRADFPSVIANCLPEGTLLAMGDRPVNLSGKSVHLAMRDR